MANPYQVVGSQISVKEKNNRRVLNRANQQQSVATRQQIQPRVAVDRSLNQPKFGNKQTNVKNMFTTFGK